MQLRYSASESEKDQMASQKDQRINEKHDRNFRFRFCICSV